MRNVKLLLALAALLLLPISAEAASRTAWTGGNGQGIASWSSRTTAFGTADLTSLASGSSVLSSATAIANQTNLDLYADISVQMTITSATPTAGGFIAVYVVPLGQDGTTYGDGGLVAGTQKVYIPPYAPICTIPLVAAATTIMAGTCTNVLLPPEQFEFAVYNFTGLAFSGTAANSVVSFKTYNLNLNN